MLTDRPISTISDSGTDPIEDTEFTLTCNVDARPDNITSYTWWQNREPLDGENKQTLTLILDHVKHNGRYACAAANVVGLGDPSEEGYHLTVYCK